MEKKIALVTGATGGIGSAIVKLLLSLGYIVYAPIRNMDKARRIFGDDSRIFFELVDIEKEEPVREYIQRLLKQGIVFNYVFQAAGDFVWDDEFAKFAKTGDVMDLQRVAIEKMMVINYDTAESLFTALLEEENDLSQTVLVGISSQAAGFEKGHEKRVGEEGYVVSKARLSGRLRQIESLRRFKYVFVEEPALVGTDKAKLQFTAHRIGNDPDWEKGEKKAEQYAEELISKIGLR